MKHRCRFSLAQTIDKDKYIIMKNLNLIAEELFNKIRGRFPSVTLGDGEGKVTNIPKDARFFDFDYKEGAINLGKVSVSLAENSVEIMYSDNFVSEQDELTKENWYNFLKEIRQFSKKRLMSFDTRNINKSNLDKRDYKFLAQNRGEETMSESKMYGTGRVSYQKVDGARLVVKHTESVNTEIAGGRTRSIGKIYIESADGERFMYPFKHLSGARAMARHVAEGGKPFDEFGTHIVGLSEEMNKLRKFKSYMGRNAVMAESLAGYSDAVNDRIKLVKRTIESLQKPKFYAETFKSFAPAVMEDVPADVKENWIDQLTIKQFNEELSDVFPYIYNLVSEATKATELSAEDLLGEGPIDWAKGKINDFKQGRKDRSQQYDQDLHILRTILAQSGMDKFDINNIEQSCNNDPRVCLIKTVKSTGAELGDMDQEVSRIAKELGSGFTTSNAMGKESYESQLEDSFEDMMGQFAEAKEETKVCKDCGDTFNKPTTDCKHDSHDPKGSHWVDANNNGIGDLDEAYIDSAKDASDLLGELRGIGKSFERGQAEMPRGFANRYVSDVWDVYTWIESKTNGFSGIDKDFKSAIDDMMKLRGIAKKKEIAGSDDSGMKDGAFGNQVVTVLYPVMQYMDAHSFDKKEDDESMEEDEQKTPLGEFILSYFDRENGAFPKGETAILTMVEKDYGEEFIEPAKQFIEQVTAKFEEIQMRNAPQQIETPDTGEHDRIRELAGLR